ERKFTDFLAQYLPAQPGIIETAEGQEIGQHQGLMYHTLGQRKGLLIGGMKEFGEQPWYVVDKDMQRNVLIVGQGADHPRLFSSGLVANQLNWVDRKGPEGILRCTVKTRYRQHDIDCTLTPSKDGSLEVIFDTPQKAVTPGQSAVFYAQDICLGGGIIESYIR
ncbi:MAG: tRNA-specific 2-thiouridylase, partial [Paraglaciecola sp.]